MNEKPRIRFYPKDLLKFKESGERERDGSKSENLRVYHKSTKSKNSTCTLKHAIIFNRKERGEGEDRKSIICVFLIHSAPLLSMEIVMSGKHSLCVRASIIFVAISCYIE